MLELGLAGELGDRPAEALRDLGVPARPDDQKPTLAHFPPQELQKEQGWVVGTVEILQNQNQRVALRTVLEEAGDRVEEPEARL